MDRFSKAAEGINLEANFNGFLAMEEVQNSSLLPPPNTAVGENPFTSGKSNVYGKLLIVQTALLISSASSNDSACSVIAIDLFSFLVVLVVAATFLANRKTFFFCYVGIALTTTICDIVSQVTHGTSLSTVSAIFSASGYAGLLIVAIHTLIKRLAGVTKVDLDALYGGISVYLLIAFLWFTFYGLIEIMDPNAFRYANARTGTYDLMYFSFNTLTTLGQGDIVPVHRWPMVLCNIEAMIGQIFPAVFIARLVSFYVVAELESRNPTPISKV